MSDNPTQNRRRHKSRKQFVCVKWFRRLGKWFPMGTTINDFYYISMRVNKFAMDRKVVRFDSKDDARKALISAVIFVTFLIVNVIVMIESVDRYRFFFNDRVKNAYVVRDIVNSETNSINFKKLLTVPIYWDYIEYCVLNLFHGTHPQLKDEEKKNLSDSGVNLDGNEFLMDNLVLGPPRFRQHRVANRSCSVPVEFKRYFDYCFAEYSQRSEAKARYYKGSIYRTAKETFTYPIVGRVAKYDGGGYKLDLTWNGSENLKIIHHLRDINWIDRGTRMVVFEYSIFNHNLQMYGTVKLLAEILPTGFIITRPYFCTVKDYSYFNNPSIVVKVSLVILYMMLFYYIICSGTQIYFGGVRNFISLNVNRIEVGVLISHICMLIFNVWHWHRIGLYKKLIRGGRFLTLDPLCANNYYYTNIMGILSVLLMLQIFQFLQFNITVRKVILTFKKIYMDLFGFLVMFLIAFLAYAQLGILLFSKVHYGFQDFLYSIMTLTGMVLHNFDSEPLGHEYPITSAVYLISFIFIIFCILLNMFLAFTVATFAIVTAEIGEPENFLVIYVKELVLYYYHYIIYLGKPPAAYNVTEEKKEKVEIIDLWDKKRDAEFPERQRKLRQQMRQLDRIQRRTEILENYLNMMTVNMDDLLHVTETVVQKSSYKKSVARFAKRK